MQIVISRSSKPDKKFEARIDGRKSIHFGQAGASDFTQHKNLLRKERYLQRHSKNEDWNNCKTAGFYARWLLWNKETLAESIRDTNRRFQNLNIIYKINALHPNLDLADLFLFVAHRVAESFYVLHTTSMNFF